MQLLEKRMKNQYVDLLVVTVSPEEKYLRDYRDC